MALARTGRRVAYYDCDVEEPNGSIFFEPEIEERVDVSIPVPRVNASRCTLCGDCSVACEYNALAVLGKGVEVFPSLCHGCGGCVDVCPEAAMVEVPRVIGHISKGVGMGVRFYEGRLNVGEALSPPITRAMKKLLSDSELSIIDAPPGTSCPVIEAISDTDFVILITEPTPFGLNDLKLAVQMVRALGLPHGVIINRSDIGDDRTREYCAREKVDVLLELPYDNRLAEAYSRGEMILDLDRQYRVSLNSLFDNIMKRLRYDRTYCSQR